MTDISEAISTYHGRQAALATLANQLHRYHTVRYLKEQIAGLERWAEARLRAIDESTRLTAEDYAITILPVPEYKN